MESRENRERLRHCDELLFIIQSQINFVVNARLVAFASNFSALEKDEAGTLVQL